MLKVYTCTKSKYVGLPITSRFETNQDDYKCIEFSDGEMEVHFESSVRGDDVFLIQSVTTPAAFVELLLAINAAKLASAKSVTAVIPYLGYARQDRKSRPRVSLGAKVILQAIEGAGASRIITMDLHAAQEVGFVNIPVDHLRATSVFIPELKSKQLSEDTVIVAPDAGAAKNALLYAKCLEKPFVLCNKVREGVNHVESLVVIGGVKNKEVIVVDDMVDTAGTLCKCADTLKTMGANRVSVVFTHGVLSGQAIERLSHSQISEIYLTPTVDVKLKLRTLFDDTRKIINVVDIDELFAKAITAAYEGTSIEDLYVVTH